MSFLTYFTYYFILIINLFYFANTALKADSPPMPDPGENSSISGYILDASSKETIIGATIYLKDTKKGAYTNKSGFYSISSIVPGKYTLIVNSIGYEKYVESITLTKSQSLRRDFKIKPLTATTKEVSVEADKDVEKREISISKIDIPVKQLKEIRIGGESDIFRSLQFLPGVLTSSQISSGLFVRGGSPDQNLVLLDGSTVYNPSHLFGFISTFNTDAIKDVELIKGGYPAEFGGRLSAVLNLTQRDGNQEKTEGIANIGIISSKISLDGPIGNGSWFISGRRTYFDLILGLLPDDPQNPFPNFHFYDVNAKISQNLGDNDKVYLSGFLSSDYLTYTASGISMDLGIGNQLLA